MRWYSNWWSRCLRMRKNYINDMLENCADEAHEQGMDDGGRIAIKTVDNWLIKAYGAGKAKEIWDDIWPTNRMRK